MQEYMQDQKGTPLYYEWVSTLEAGEKAYLPDGAVSLRPEL